MGYTNPLYVLAVYAPAIEAIVLVAFYHGKKGLLRFLKG